MDFKREYVTKFWNSPGLSTIDIFKWQRSMWKVFRDRRRMLLFIAIWRRRKKDETTDSVMPYASISCVWLNVILLITIVCKFSFEVYTKSKNDGALNEPKMAKLKCKCWRLLKNSMSWHLYDVFMKNRMNVINQKKKKTLLNTLQSFLLLRRSLNSFSIFTYFDQTATTY